MLELDATRPAATSCRFRGRPTCPTACCARSTIRRSIIAGPSSRGSSKTVLAGMKKVFKTDGARRHLPGVGHRRVGSGAGQHAVARRPRADVRDRPLRDAVAAAWPSGSGSSSNSCPATGATAPTPAQVEAQARGRQARTRSRRCCVVHNETSTGVTTAIADVRAGDRPRRPSGAVHGRHDLVARLDRLPPRRMGRRRHRRRLAERPDAAAGAVVQRGQRQGARREQERRGCRARTGTGTRCSRSTRQGYFPYTPATNLLYGLHEALDMLLEEGLDRTCSRATTATPKRRAARCAPGASKSCARNPAEYSASLTAVMMPEGHDADAFRKIVLERFDMSLGTGPRASSRARCSASGISATSTT